MKEHLALQVMSLENLLEATLATVSSASPLEHFGRVPLAPGIHVHLPRLSLTHRL